MEFSDKPDSEAKNVIEITVNTTLKTTVSKLDKEE